MEEHEPQRGGGPTGGDHHEEFRGAWVCRRPVRLSALVDRNYVSNASIQVMLFSDRLEVWNPGQLPPSLSPEALRAPHPSIPRNPLITEPFFLTCFS